MCWRFFVCFFLLSKCCLFFWVWDGAMIMMCVCGLVLFLTWAGIMSWRFFCLFYSPNTVFFLLINTVYFVCALNVVCVYVRLFLINVGALNVLALFLCVFVFFFTLQMLFIFECGLERWLWCVCVALFLMWARIMSWRFFLFVLLAKFCVFFTHQCCLFCVWAECCVWFLFFMWARLMCWRV